MKLKESKLTITNYGITASVGYDHNDVGLEQWYDAFKGCLVGVGFTEEQLENFILEIAESISDVRESHCPPFEGEKKGFNGINEDALSESFLNTIKPMNDNRNGDEFVVMIDARHRDYWDLYPTTLDSTTGYSLYYNGHWYPLFGGKHVYREMPIEMFERRYYNPWKQSQQPSLDVSNQ
jgi:hypothetical protein